METNDIAAPLIPSTTNSTGVSVAHQSGTEQVNSNTNLRQSNTAPDKFIFRYQYLLIEVGADVLRKLLDFQTGNDVVKHLTAKSQDIQQLIKAKVITADQKQLLPPIDNQPDSSKFDISLLSCLLRNVCGLRFYKDPVWTTAPTPADISVEADITRLRMCRNQLMHSDKLRLPEAELDSKWKDLSAILIRLNKVCGITQLQADINHAETIDIDQRLQEQRNNTIKTWYESDPLLRQRIDEIKSDVTNVKQDVNTVMSEVYNVKQDLDTVMSEVSNVKQEIDTMKRKLPTTQHDIKRQCVGMLTDTDDDGPESGDKIPVDTSTESDDVFPEDLRSYQIELAEPAIKGNNTIVCSETGSGKTFVALEIIKRHLEDKKGPQKAKVAYMAKTGLLLRQQARRAIRYLSIETKVITGEDDDSQMLPMYMDMFDIIFLTPQILINNLDENAVKSLTEFSLLILDECHHTRGEEPYNILMRRYLVEKSQHINGLPQIVGLTASIGVGKSRTDEDAVEYIIKVMAFLDVRILATVEKNIDELSKHINRAVEETIPLINVKGPCIEILLEAIEKTEDLLLDPTFMQPGISDLITNIPDDKGSPAYIKWTVDMSNVAQTYGSALEVNKLLLSKDVIIHLAEKHTLDGMHKEKHTKVEKKLYKKLKDNLTMIQKKCKGTENPNVRTVSVTLKQMLDEKGDESRALVFVKTRATCLALKKFLVGDLRDSGYKTESLYGKDNRGGYEGMSESLQTDTLEKFRTGVYKVLVCTSIGTEGIDVPKCNIVLSYEYSGDEITKIQMKGRVRKDDASMTFMGSKKMIEQDMKNIYKTAMMQRAIMKFKEYKKCKPQYIEQKIKQFQKDELSKHHIKIDTEKDKEARKTDEDHDILCRGCSMFACLASNVRKQKSYYVIIDKGILDKVDRKPHGKPTHFDGFDKKVTKSSRSN